MSGEPKFIGRYAIESPLGRGAMGMIYRAHDPDIDRKVAIKLIRADLLDGDNRPSFIARFRREAQAAARCAHPNIVAIYDFALHEGNPFLAMEFVDGITLEQARQASTRFAPEDAVFVILQVLAALDAAHGMGVVHRDIKPANIMLVGGNLVKVTDFGISRLDTSSLTMGGVTIGTPSYMSPEQCRGETIDARSDLFSTGVVLYELLAGRKPFEGRNTAEVFARLLHEDAPDLAQACPGLPEGVRSVVARSLAKTPRDRFASAREMIAAVKTAAAEGGTVYRDRTIILPPAPAPAPAIAAKSADSPAATGSFDPELLDTVQRKLAEYVGPIARYLVRTAVRKTDTLEGLFAALAEGIERPNDRNIFVQDIRRQIARTGTGTVMRAAVAQGSAILPGELERLQTVLARYVGPIARVLIKRAAASAASAPALWQALSAHIDDADARAAFLREAPKSMPGTRH